MSSGSGAEGAGGESHLVLLATLVVGSLAFFRVLRRTAGVDRRVPRLWLILRLTDVPGAVHDRITTRLTMPSSCPRPMATLRNWAGDVPGNNENFSGKVDIQIGPVLGNEVGDWG